MNAQKDTSSPRSQFRQTAKTVLAPIPAQAQFWRPRNILCAKNLMTPRRCQMIQFSDAPGDGHSPAKSGTFQDGRPSVLALKIPTARRRENDGKSEEAGAFIGTAKAVAAGVEREEIRGILKVQQGDVAEILRTGRGD